MKNALTFLFLIMLGIRLFAQPPIITEIAFSGITRTQPAYLSTFIQSKVGDKLDSIQLEEDRKILANLEILGNASYLVTADTSGCKITFDCIELYSLIPIFNFGGIQDNLWFLIGGTDVNLLGKGHKTYIYYQYYDRHSIAAHLSLDWLKGSPWGVNVNMIKWSTLEPLFFEGGTVSYNYDNYTIGLEGIFHFNYFDKITFGAGAFREEYNAVSELVSNSPASAVTNKTIFKLIWNSNHTYSSYFYLDGFSNTFTSEAVYSLDGDPDFYIAFNDFRWYRRFSERGNWASRARVGFSTNQNSPFAPFVLDSYINIRGVGNRVDRGTGSLVINSEYRQSIIDQNRFAIQAVGFVDVGTWRTPGGTLNDFIQQKNVKAFAGVGCRIIHKKIYNAIFRIDYGFDLNKDSKRGFVMGIGQYF